MIHTATPIKTKPINIFPAETQPPAAMHLAEAAKYRYDARAQFEAGNHIRGCESTVKAYKYLCLARKETKEQPRLKY